MLVVFGSEWKTKELRKYSQNFLELAMAHQGEVKAVVTSVIVSFSALNFLSLVNKWCFYFFSFSLSFEAYKTLSILEYY